MLDLPKYITAERLIAYKNDPKLYEWNLKISESLYTPLNYFEIVFRNICNNKLKKDLGDDWYLNNNVLLGNNTQTGQWTVNEIQKTMKKIMKNKTKKGFVDYQITINDIVSNLEFGFWTNIFSANYANTIWNPYLGYIFKNFKTNDFHNTLDIIRELRNRIFHYETIIFNPNLENIYISIMDLILYMSDDDTLIYIKSISNFEGLWNVYKQILGRSINPILQPINATDTESTFTL
jgi:hypothetical protein